MATILYRNGTIYSVADPFATALLIDSDTVAWIGGEEAADRYVDKADEVIDLEGALITPAFVESHTHLAALGRKLGGADLSAANSSTELLGLLAARAQGATSVIIGQGWDESSWSDAQIPTETDLSSAAEGRPYYLARRDLHSALVNQELLDQLGLGSLTSGQVFGAEHEQVRRGLLAQGPGVDEYQRLALEHYAARGFATVVEMAAPHLEGRQALDQLLAQDNTQLPAVYAYWGERVTEASSADELMRSFPQGRVLGLGGELCVDGSLGSRTALLREDYTDDAGNRGVAYLTEEQISAHLVACSTQGIQAAFHVVGDAAMDLLLQGFDAAAAEIGVAKLQSGRHRIEHAEMVDEPTRQRLLQYSITVSMQPGFDALWGGSEGMYAQRLGERAATMNNLSAMLSSGVPLVLGADAPVTEVDGWSLVRAAMTMSNEAGRISARAGFMGQTRSTYRAMGEMNPFAGQLVIGAPATYAVWSASELAIQTPDQRISSWSTDARAGTPMLPVVDQELPTCLRTVRAGVTLFDQLDQLNEPSA